MHWQMADRAGNHTAVQLRLRFSDQPDKFPEAEKGLLQQVVGVGQPQHLEAVGQRVSADEMKGRECLTAPGRKDKDSSTRLRGCGFVPLVEVLERCRLMGRRAFGN